MLLKLFLAFTLIPLMELYLLIQLGSVLGVFTTIGLVIITGFVGATLAKLQGIQTMMRVRECLASGIMPQEELIDAVIIFVAGVVLLTPGFLSDALGLFLLIPATRDLFKRFLRSQFDKRGYHAKVYRP